MPEYDIGNIKGDGWVDFVGPWGRYAAEEIYATYGDRVGQKWKALNKFGKAVLSSANIEYTVADLGSTVANNEVLTTANTIDTIASDSSVDTQEIYLEGHTISTLGALTFKTTVVTIAGTTPTTFAGMARVTRAYVNDVAFGSEPADNVGTIRVWESAAQGSVTSGVPANSSALHIAIPAGANQSEKCQTAISDNDYFVIDQYAASLRKDSGGGAGSCDVELQIKRRGGVWRQIGKELTLISSGENEVTVTVEPPIIVPPNSDVRLRANPSTVDLSISGSFNGVLLSRLGSTA